jgi:hypothetical protein
LNYIGTLAWALNIGQKFIDDLKQGGIYAHFYEQYDKLKFGLIKARGHDSLRIINAPEKYLAAFPETYHKPITMLLEMWCASWCIVSNPYLTDTFWLDHDESCRHGLAADLLHGMAKAMKDLLHGLFSSAVITPTLHMVVDDIPHLFAQGHDLWWGNETTIEAGQQLARSLLESLQKSSSKNADMICHWVTYLESQLIVRTAQERQAAARTRLTKLWSTVRFQRVLRGQAALGRYQAQLAELPSTDFDFTILYGGQQSWAAGFPDNVTSLALQGVTDLPQLLYELDALDIAKVVVRHDKADGTGKEADIARGRQAEWLTATDLGVDWEDGEGLAAAEPASHRRSTAASAAPAAPHPTVNEQDLPLVSGTGVHAGKFWNPIRLGQDKPRAWIRNNKANRDRVQRTWPNVVASAVEALVEEVEQVGSAPQTATRSGTKRARGARDQEEPAQSEQSEATEAEDTAPLEDVHSLRDILSPELQRQLCAETNNQADAATDEESADALARAVSACAGEQCQDDDTEEDSADEDEDEDEDEQPEASAMQEGWAPYCFSPEHNVLVVRRAQPRSKPLLPPARNPGSRLASGELSATWAALVKRCAQVCGTSPRQTQRFLDAIDTMMEAFLEAGTDAGMLTILELARLEFRTDAERAQCQQILQAAWQVLKDRDPTNSKSIALNLGKSALNKVRDVVCAPASVEPVLQLVHVEEAQPGAPIPWARVRALEPVRADAYRISLADGPEQRVTLDTVVGGLTADAHPDFRRGVLHIDVAVAAELMS